MFFWKKKKDPHHHHPKDNIIPLEQAIRETTDWRERYGPELGGVKGFFIPMKDLHRIVRRYKKYRPKGARAYIGLVKSATPGNSRIRMILVPATECKDFFDKGPGTIGLPGVGISSVYDFTMPCPDTCASDSPLDGATY